jgi:tetratricopeptide (TPR) repeat protein
MKKFLITISILLLLFVINLKGFTQDINADLNQAITFSNDGKYNEAAELFAKWIPAVKEELGANDTTLYLKLVSWAGTCYYQSGKFEQAESLMKEAMRIDKEFFGENHPSYSRDLNNIAALYQAMGWINQAEPLMKEAIRITKETLGENHPSYGIRLNNLAQLYQDIGRYELAEQLMKEAMKIAKESLGENHPTYGIRLNNLAQLYHYMGRFEQAEPLMKEAMRITKESVGNKHPEYGRDLNNLAQLYQDMGLYEQVEPLMKEAIRIDKESLGENHPDYGIDLNNLAQLYHYMGRYEQAEPLMKEAIRIDKESLGEKHPEYGRDLNNLAQLYQDMGKYELAVPLMKEVLRIIKESLGENHPSYGTYLNNMAELYQAMGRYEQAEPLMKEALRIIKESLGENHPEYPRALNNIAKLYLDMGRYEQGESLMKEAILFAKESLGENHLNIVNYLANLAVLYHHMGQYEQEEQLMKEAYSKMKYNLQKNSGYLSEAELHQFVGMLFYNLEVYQSFNYYRSVSGFEDGRFAMDIELFRKGLLLKSVIETRKRILESGDSVLINSYQKMLLYLKQADYLNTLTSEKRLDDQARLDLKANELEKELKIRSKEYSQNQEEAEIDWKQIREKLNSDDVVIEFSSFDYFNKHRTDSTLYCALVLRKEYNYPKLIYLCENNQLENIAEMGSAAYNKEFGETKLFNLIWRPIDSLLKGVKTVYYSPSGLLHKISFAAIRMKDGRYLSDQYVFRTLSSTRNLAIEKQPYTLTEGQKIVMFGGIDYWTDTTSLKNTAIAYHPKEELVSMKSNPLKGGNRVESEWDSLPDARKEVETVASYLSKKGIDVVKYTGKGAIEERVKDLSNHSPDILFISTHGFTLEQDTSISKEKRLEILELTDNPLMKKIKYYDDPLLRSGLVMAGANHAWKEGKAIQGVDNGILTAKEISLLNLGNTKLAVLSACETALGDVQGEEGVYGLQRALFMAGVKNIIVSLWSVPSKETEEMMILFYENLLSGKTLEDAFYTTQKVMKQNYPDDPKSWAGFILIE